VLVGLGITLFLSHSSGPRGSISLPARLLALPRYAGIDARSFDARLAKKVTTGPDGPGIVRAVGGEYGDLLGSGPLVLVIGGELCGTCTADPTGRYVKRLVASGRADVPQFPPGPGGGALVER
jgi:hypothetical protein